MKDTPTLLTCFFPTTVLFLDDDSNFLSRLQLKLDVNQIVPKFFDYPEKALQFIQNHHVRSFIDGCIRYPEEVHLGQRRINIDISQIAQEMYRKERFDEPSVLVVDYRMPGTDGLQVCERVRHKRFRKLMLTGDADETLAIRAFNRGLIGRFVRKDHFHFAQELNKAITELQSEYFHDLSSGLIDALTLNLENHPLPCLTDPAYIELFNKIQKEHDFREYYLADTRGSFFFLDFAGNASCLILRNEEDMESTLAIAQTSDTSVPDAVITAVESFEKVLFTPEFDDYRLEPSSWEPYLYPASVLEGNEKYYYAFIKDAKSLVNPSRIQSFKSYVEELTGIYPDRAGVVSK